MKQRFTHGPPEASRWCSRAALFSVGIIITAVVAHRLLGAPTPMAALLFIAALVCAFISVVLGIWAGFNIWARGSDGTARSIFGVLISLAVLTIPLVTLMAAAPYPTINDITTDAASPPPYKAVVSMRSPGTNPTSYPGAKFAARQSKAYPDIKPILIDRPTEEAFDLVVDAMNRMKLNVVRQDRPEKEAPGFIEAVDRTLIMGFYDDVAVRVAAAGVMTRVDLRSSSRFGQNDFGRNADRLRLLTTEIDNRVKATAPTQEELDARAAEARAKAARAARAKARAQRKERRRKWRRRRRR